MADKKPFAGVAQDDSIALLRRIFQMLKPLTNVVGNGLNTLIVSLSPNPTLTGSTLGAVTAVAALNNIVAVGGVSAFDQMKSTNRLGYSNGPRSNLSWA